MNEILRRIQCELSASVIDIDKAVIYLGRSEWYDMLLSMRGFTPIHSTYVDEELRYTCFGVEVIEVNRPKYLRVA